TTIIRFRATSDLGTSDIGLDNVRLLTPCTGAPAAASISATPASVCAGGTAVLTATGLDVYAGVSLQWEQSDDGGNTWVPVVGGSGGTTASYTTPALNLARMYHLVQTCSYSTQSSASNAVNVTINQPVYAVYDNLSYAEGFENWMNTCDSLDIPSASWRNLPATGNNSWRRNDQGPSSPWSGTSGGYTPVSSAGAHSARFHTYNR